MNWILCTIVVHIVTVVVQSQNTTVSTTTLATTTLAPSYVRHNLFAADIFKAVALGKSNENVVISPAAMHISLVLAYYGAKGKTATEMQTGLRLGSGDPEEVVRGFAEFQQTFASDKNVRLMNKIYINEKLEFNDKFNEIAQRYFDLKVEKADFHPPQNKDTADSINKLIEEKTNKKIRNVIKPEQLNDLTEGVIVNGISFSAPWKNAFKADKTSRRPFLVRGTQEVQVDTMWTLNNFKYAELDNFDAKVVELPYQNTDFAMLVFLPNKNDGLRDLEQRLAGNNLVTLVEYKLIPQKVEVYLPKFSITYGVDLQEPLKQLGITTMFTGETNRMFVSDYNNTANYKAHVEVAEAGDEQPQELGVIKRLFSRHKILHANYPFLFAIRYKYSIIFMGHITSV